MLLVSIILFTGIAVLLIWRRHRLFLLEALAIGLFISTLDVNIADVVVGNLKLLEITKELQMFWSFLLLRYLLIPVLVILCMDLYASAETPLHKMGALLFFISLIALANYAMVWAGAVRFVHFYWWSVLLEWTSVVLAAVNFRRLYHTLVRKGSSAHDL